MPFFLLSLIFVPISLILPLDSLPSEFRWNFFYRKEKNINQTSYDKNVMIRLPQFAIGQFSRALSNEFTPIYAPLSRRYSAFDI